jgi:hypothetical protein
MRIPLLILIAGLSLGFGLSAQGGPGGPPPQGQGQGQPPRLAYDASQEVTLEGSVTAVTVATQGPGPFVTLSFRSGDKTYEVLAGPQAVLTQNQVSFTQGDALTILGVVQAGPKGNRFLARQITKGTTVVTLLDSNGQPTGMARPS